MAILFIWDEESIGCNFARKRRNIHTKVTDEEDWRGYEDSNLGFHIEATRFKPSRGRNRGEKFGTAVS